MTILPGCLGRSAPDAGDGLNVKEIENILREIPLWQRGWAEDGHQTLR